MNRIFWKFLGCVVPAVLVAITFNTAHPLRVLVGLTASIVLANACGYVEGALKARGITL